LKSLRNLGFTLTLALVLAMPLNAATQAGTPSRVSESTIDGGRFGPVHVYRPDQNIVGVVLFFSGDGGWEGGVIDHARRLAGEGYLVGGVDVRNYLESIRLKPVPHVGSAAACVSLANEVESLSQHLQRTLGLSNYSRPVLFGYSAGAAVVYSTLAQAPVGLFSGGVSLGFCPEMDFGGATLCTGAGLHFKSQPRGKANEVELAPDPSLHNSWSIVHGDLDTVCGAAATKSFTSAIPGARLTALPQAGHELRGADAWWPKLRQDYQAMESATLATDARLNSAPPDALLDLPITEVPAGISGSDVFAVMISGDGGWATLDQGLSAALAARGVPVAGLNSLRYFWQERTPERTATDVDRMIEHYAAQWHKTRVLLIGYSFGADVMPSVFNRLRAQSRARVASINLLGLGPGATYEVSAAEWLPGASRRGAPVLPEIAKFGSTPALCIDGAGERHTMCPELEKLGIEVRQIGEGHHFSGLAQEIAEAIIRKR
jgi:type IV secretory pathway VirJ component